MGKDIALFQNDDKTFSFYYIFFSFRYLVTGGDRGYELAQTKQCNQCADKYPNCLPGQYDQVKTMSDRYERDMIKGAGSSVDTEFMPFK